MVSSNLKSNTWIGEQTDPRGHGLSLREGRGLNFQSNTGNSSRWGLKDGQSIEHKGIKTNSSVIANWVGVYTTRPFALEECRCRGGSEAGQRGGQVIKATRSS